MESLELRTVSRDEVSHAREASETCVQNRSAKLLVATAKVSRWAYLCLSVKLHKQS